ncbi:hypothetical protein FA95DRAFT_1514751 [Auriscalpium vulgare]|uniref:Uncharacterized protein n=1 Tax=Auriscalpium vulgare TaxID=40419 RepID=A0ACB8S2H6_9AGAM|nr:hypothetical protein FA95DRAFT_1514751 [Auriscalpium vulgare]
MASYNREWDYGKDTWDDGTGGGGGIGYNSRGNVRGREEESYGDGKRRKYNDGGYDAGGWDDGAYDAGFYNQDYVPDEYSTRGGGAAGYHANKKRLTPSEPSPHVIFLGLDLNFTESDMQTYLNGQGCSIESSKGFGFAQFSSVESARAFVDPLFPFIQVPPPASHGATATAAFYKALQAGTPHGGRRVKIDYSQSASPGERARGGRVQANDGTRDIGSAQTAVLLFRGLDPLSGPAAIEQAMRLSSGPNKEGAKGMKRIVLIKDKITMASWGFAFVEFVDAQAASAVLAATMSPQIHPNGFRISDRPVAASFAHPYSFQPVSDPMLRDEASLSSSMNMGGVEDTWARYWDEGSSVAVSEFKVEQPVQQPSVPAKEKKKKPKAETGPELAQPAEASALPVSDKPVTLNFKGFGTNKASSGSAGGSTTTKVAAPITLGFSLADDGDDEAEGEGEFASTEDAKVAASRKVAPMIASKKTANNISKWNQVQEEMHVGAPTASSSIQAEATPAPLTIPTPEPKAKSATPLPEEAEFEFADMSKVACLLCARQFKTLDQLKRHNKESDLHKKNFRDANLRDIAREKARAVKEPKPAASEGPQPGAPKYRDRASERRIMHNQPDIPLPESGGAEDKRKARKFEEGPPAPPPPPPPPVNPGQDSSNKGNRLLKMMGWKEGTGLGADGEGRVDPIQTAIYATGVGLGASKGKEIGKYQDGYTGYVHMAKDAVSRFPGLYCRDWNSRV